MDKWLSSSKTGTKRSLKDTGTRPAKAPRPTAERCPDSAAPLTDVIPAAAAEPPTLHPAAPRRGLATYGDGGSRKYVIYAAISEPLASPFAEGLAACAAVCDAGVHASCFQRDGTRHVSLFEGRLADQVARKIRMSGSFDPPVIVFDEWQPWKTGCYLKLDGKTTRRLQIILRQIEGLPATGGKRSCDHLSLYRKRGADTAQAGVQFEKIRSALAKHQWGSVRASSIRIKVVGSDYDECGVLAGV
mmetsp:Transcript_308/g.748  ORF Transcript_308/g.748 Transcript_308/m.748 type:complete len:245 (+) Transcript_308:119-853(+)